MCLLLREAMTVGKIALAHQFFSNELGTPAAKTRIKDELSSYCVVTEAPKTTFGKVRKWACGKALWYLPRSSYARGRCARPTRASSMVLWATQTGLIHPFYLRAQTNHWTGKQDDLCIAIQLSLIGCQKFFQDSKYRNFRAPDYLTPNGLS